MLITKISQFSGKPHSMELPITQEQLERWTRGEDLIQRIFPNLTADQREFLMTGVTKEEWDEAFKPGDE